MARMRKLIHPLLSRQRTTASTMGYPVRPCSAAASAHACLAASNKKRQSCGQPAGCWAPPPRTGSSWRSKRGAILWACSSGQRPLAPRQHQALTSHQAANRSASGASSLRAPSYALHMLRLTRSCWSSSFCVVSEHGAGWHRLDGPVLGCGQAAQAGQALLASPLHSLQCVTGTRLGMRGASSS